jgi:Ca2+-binding EF-hand superfamily protein
MASSRVITLIAALAISGGAIHQAQAQTKPEIQKMDRNSDGVVTRAEWQGSNGAFRQHDINRDGMLSGTEVWDPRDLRGRGRGRRGNQEIFDDWTARGFAALDRNGDSRITNNEWRFDRETFTLADHNRDNAISRAEFLNESRLSRNRVDRFRDFDANNRVDRFRELDANNDGAIARTEWRDSDGTFRLMDRNRDNRVTRDEFREVVGTSGAVNPSTAYRAGYERGQAEGRVAGRVDRDRNQGWDLEGQRELEVADSGYDARFGSKAEYQAGYRDGFRSAYPEGWDRR